MRSNCDLFGSDWRWCTIVTVTIRLVQVARGVKNAFNCPGIEAAMKAVIKSVEEVCCPALKLVARSSGHLRRGPCRRSRYRQGLSATDGRA